MTQPDWDDERLDAAFHARFDRPAPTGLAKDIHVRIAGRPPARFAGLRVTRAWSLAAAAVVVILVAGTTLVGLGGLGRTGGSPLPSDASATSPSATPTAQAVPGVVLEQLQVTSFTDAIAIRDAEADDREIAVQGWFEGGVSPACPAPLANQVSPVQLTCPDGFTWLMDRPESLVHRSGNGTDMRRPDGPALNPDLDGLDLSWVQTNGGFDANGDSIPTDVVLIGHFDDRRAEICPLEEIGACRDRFVVDAVAVVHGEPQPPSVVRETGDAVSSEQDIATIVLDEAPGSQIMSATVVDGPTGLAAYEPALGTGQANLIDQRALWIVRVLESERAVTYIVIDGSDAIYEMNPEGEPILVGGESPTSEASISPGEWPPADALVVELVGGVDVSQPHVRVALVDQSGRLVSAVQQNPVAVPFEGRFGATAEPGKPGRVNLAWVGGTCDSQMTVTIAPDLGSISFDMGPQPVCDSIGIERQLILYFSGAVDVPSIQLVNGSTGKSQPSSSAEPVGSTCLRCPAFVRPDVTCGDLGPDTCNARVVEILEANNGRSVESITFTDECGSYTATFRDHRDAIGSIVECLLTPEPS